MGSIALKNKRPVHSTKPDVVRCGWLNDFSLCAATNNGYFYRYLIDDSAPSYKLEEEHLLKDKDQDLNQQQTTKIYKQPKNEEKEKEKKVEVAQERQREREQEQEQEEDQGEEQDIPIESQ